VFYDPGVGTVTEPTTWQRWKTNINMVLGLATGYGLDDNVLSAYRFLVDRYKPGDKIYLFGFSRGAYTVRVIPEGAHVHESVVQRNTTGRPCGSSGCISPFLRHSDKGCLASMPNSPRGLGAGCLPILAYMPGEAKQTSIHATASLRR